MEKNQTAELKGRIEKKRELEKKISGVNAGLNSPRMTEVITKGMSCGDAHVRLESFILRRGNGSEANVPESRRGELEALKDNAARLLTELVELQNEKKRLETELELLTAELRALDCSADATEIAAQQGKIDKAKEAAMALAKTIDEQREIINVNQSAPPKELYVKRQDLLAERAIGKDVAKDLQSVDEEISAKEEKMTSSKKLANDAEHAMEGLTRKLDEANLQIKSLENDKKEMVIFFLKTEAAKVEREYLTVAQDLADSYSRLCALDSFICQLSGNRERSFAGHNSKLFSIPAFGPNSEGGGLLFRAQTCNITAMLDKEKTRLGALGVQC